MLYDLLYVAVLMRFSVLHFMHAVLNIVLLDHGNLLLLLILVIRGQRINRKSTCACFATFLSVSSRRRRHERWLLHRNDEALSIGVR